MSKSESLENNSRFPDHREYSDDNQTTLDFPEFPTLASEEEDPELVSVYPDFPTLTSEQENAKGDSRVTDFINATRNRIVQNADNQSPTSWPKELTFPSKEEGEKLFKKATQSHLENSQGLTRDNKAGIRDLAREGFFNMPIGQDTEQSREEIDASLTTSMAKHYDRRTQFRSRFRNTDLTNLWEEEELGFPFRLGHDD